MPGSGSESGSKAQKYICRKCSQSYQLEKKYIKNYDWRPSRNLSGIDFHFKIILDPDPIDLRPDPKPCLSASGDRKHPRDSGGALWPDSTAGDERLALLMCPEILCHKEFIECKIPCIWNIT